MDCSCDVNGGETTCTVHVVEHGFKSQSVLPKITKTLPHKGERPTAPVSLHRPKNIYVPYSIESIKAKAYGNWLRNQIR
jgi:hypothetical protein